MDDADKFLFGLVFFVVAALMSLIIFLALTQINEIEGPVTGKQFIEEHTVCSKGCTTHPDCWEVEVDSEPWYDDTKCVSESRYNDLSIGDHFKE